MPNNSSRIVISLGGSLIVPNEIDTVFLNRFKQVILSEIKRGRKFVLITGGGKTSRKYIEAAKKTGDLNPDDLDWLGIHSTRLNGHLLRTVFRRVAHRTIITNPFKPITTKDHVIVAAGYIPGWSTDYDAVVLASKYKAKIVLNLSNIEYVYDRDPRKDKRAKKIVNISWPDFRKIVGTKWNPGAHVPFDPVAAKLAHKLKLRVIVANGRNMKNIINILTGKKFIGTIIE